jgi:hypothetical protein
LSTGVLWRARLGRWLTGALLWGLVRATSHASPVGCRALLVAEWRERRTMLSPSINLCEPSMPPSLSRLSTAHVYLRSPQPPKPRRTFVARYGCGPKLRGRSQSEAVYHDGTHLNPPDHRCTYVRRSPPRPPRTRKQRASPVDTLWPGTLQPSIEVMRRMMVSPSVGACGPAHPCR